MENLNDKTCFLNEWFSPKLEYNGWGKAEFIMPEGVAEGHTKIEFDEFGNSTIEMLIEKVETKPFLPFGIHQFLSGESESYETNNGNLFVGIGISGKTNICSKLEVSTMEGTFIVENTEFYENNITLGYSIGFAYNSKPTIKFNVSISSFISKLQSNPVYWVLPLVNFIGDFQLVKSDEVHPLYKNSKSLLIPFIFDHKPSFIQPVDDFEEKRNSLLKGYSQKALTALMIGNIGTNSINDKDLEKWFPFDFINLLGLATGSEVGVPWIEFRDEQGKIVKRYHQVFGLTVFTKGHVAINENLHNGIGSLLTTFPQFMQSANYKTLPLRAIIRNLIKSGYYSTTIEDKIEHVCRGIVALCRYYKLDTTNLLENLPTKHRKDIEEIIDQTQTLITLKAKEIGEVEDSRQLFLIAEKIKMITKKTVDFGLATCQLLKKFDMPDANIIDQYYKVNARADGLKTWANVISKYRNVTIRESYFNFAEGNQKDRYNINDVLRITNHLHDILLRIILKLFQYEGFYRPTVSKYLSAYEKIDWVKSDTEAYLLGYQEEL